MPSRKPCLSGWIRGRSATSAEGLRAACRPSRDVGGSRRGIFGWAPLRWLAERVLCLPASEAEAERTVAHGRDSGLQMAAIIAGLCCRERLNHGLRHSLSGTPLAGTCPCETARYSGGCCSCQST
jgi:hypothetical protein